MEIQRVTREKKRILKLVDETEDGLIQKTCNRVFSLTTNDDTTRVKSLGDLNGVGPALASAILTFYDPKKYAVFDIHIWREMRGKEPKNLFTARNYLKLLADLRRIASDYNLDVRTVEKALFKKNVDKTGS